MWNGSYVLLLMLITQDKVAEIRTGDYGEDVEHIIRKAF